MVRIPKTKEYACLLKKKAENVLCSLPSFLTSADSQIILQKDLSELILNHYKGVIMIATTEKERKTWTRARSFRTLNRYFASAISGYPIVMMQRTLRARSFVTFLTE